MRFAALVLIFLSTAACTRFFYYPSENPVTNPGVLGLQYEDVIIQTKGEPDLQAWFLPAGRENAPTILFLHGNAGNISTHLPLVYWLPAEGFNVLLFDYRGYGNSGGSPGIAGIHKDIERAIAALEAKPELAQSGLILYGQSLGAAMALYTAALPAHRNTFRAVVAESPFGSYRSIAREKAASTLISWPFQPLVWLLIPDNYSPARYVQNISCPHVLIIAAENDDIVPAHHSVELAERLGGKADLWLVPGKNHMQVFSNLTYRRRLAEYLRGAL